MRRSRGITSAAWAPLRQAALERDGWRCRECSRAGALEVHHAHPVHLGGHTPDNLISLCPDCHIRMHSKPLPSDWEKLRKGIVRA